MTNDFSFGLHPGPEDINGVLREQGIEPERLVVRRDLRVSDVGHLEGYVGKGGYEKSMDIAYEYNELMPILVVDRPGGFEVINGAHRLRAAKIRDDEYIAAIVVPEKALDLIYHPYGSVAMHRWAHITSGTGYDPGYE